MNKRFLALAALGLASLLANCTEQPSSNFVVSTKLKVWGAPSNVSRFVDLDNLKYPPKLHLLMHKREDGRVEATLAVPNSYSSDEIVKITKRALDMDLNYELTSSRTS
ncbi:hypothetical protein [Novosphingopyxis iocasae]|uniref:hypothetical protein n=1 Tax=Novosphingopyxis iocasae TaxID=2762729 RepID=UPI0016515F9D|nr:hypothetical protein [Novosphingopyxis iocasae]